MLKTKQTVLFINGTVRIIVTNITCPVALCFNNTSGLLLKYIKVKKVPICALIVSKDKVYLFALKNTNRGLANSMWYNYLFSEQKHGNKLFKKMYASTQHKN